ncbi:unnamed protein product [Lepeophtheirus salmonis]|uniref:(salmon louse) hypothetical protein n=1 Tax=Lepeophtheirus salmonis TaxID=72036 RepID=A0A7R8CYX3_LEPSM|nr:unnamed protein product [Lepeophtheirus salmonis]CAF2944943.1 unnamed protein product [Lepeophtheirus salmonis]
MSKANSPAMILKENAVITHGGGNFFQKFTLKDFCMKTNNETLPVFNQSQSFWIEENSTCNSTKKNTRINLLKRLLQNNCEFKTAETFEVTGVRYQMASPNLNQLEAPDSVLQINEEVIPPCCIDRTNKIRHLMREREILKSQLKDREIRLTIKDEEMKSRMSDLSIGHSTNVRQLKGMLASQLEVHEEWIQQMVKLIEEFNSNLKLLTDENILLKKKLSETKEIIQSKDKEFRDAQELCGIYSSKLTRLKRQYKKLKDSEEDSFIEITL